ncbi:hypothetical protein P3393_23360 [Vibrio parahaemolyticus]|nr:hypothetical protein [Vibrio parahaemolyticus]
MSKVLSEIYSFLDDLDSKLPKVVYKFQPHSEFEKLKDPKSVQFIYWSEIIQRYHITSSSTILRLKKWYEAMISAYKGESYYGFCCAIRGLVESCSDSFYSLGKITYPVAENFKHIKEALEQKTDTIVFAEELENELIHYIYGRKLSAAERRNNPESHNAMQVRQYLDSMKSADLDQLYAELCQISHPSMLSNVPFMYSQGEDNLVIHNQNIDKQLIEDLLKRHRKTIYDASMLAIVPALCSFKMINSLDLEFFSSLRLDESIFDTLNESDIWKDLELKMANKAFKSDS